MDGLRTAAAAHWPPKWWRTARGPACQTAVSAAGRSGAFRSPFPSVRKPSRGCWMGRIFSINAVNMEPTFFPTPLPLALSVSVSIDTYPLKRSTKIRSFLFVLGYFIVWIESKSYTECVTYFSINKIKIDYSKWFWVYLKFNIKLSKAITIQLMRVFLLKNINFLDQIPWPNSMIKTRINS